MRECMQDTEFSVNYGNSPLVVIAILFLALLTIADQWTTYYWYTAFGTVVTYFLARQFQKWWRWRKLGKDSLFFDPGYFVSIDTDEIQVLPLSRFITADIIESTTGAYFLARFHFRDQSITIPCQSSSDNAIIRFQNILTQYCNQLKHSDVGPKDVHDFVDNLSTKILSRRSAFISATFALLILWFIIPMIIDRNQYLHAQEANTATAYRKYLSEPHNLRYRETARNDIKYLYNQSIEKYRSMAQNSVGANAFAQVLEYLRDRNLYTVRMTFFPESKLVNVPLPDEYRIIPVTPSFSSNKNEARQVQVINTVRASMEQLFPADILTIASDDLKELPTLEVYYSYRNNPETLYYPVKDEHLPEKFRTWYYGIEIDWWFAVSIPIEVEPIYTFTLTSRPAPKFESESYEADVVYSNMALSAFNDFKREFYKHFLNW